MFAAHRIVSDPIHQFRVIELIRLDALGLNLSFTNSSLFMLIAAVSVCAPLAYIASHASIRPNRLQTTAEAAYHFVVDMVRSTMGDEGLRFFPLVFALFSFIFMANMLGMIPYFFTTTSHIIVNFSLAILVMSVVIGFGLWRNKTRFFAIFMPSGVPVVLVPLVVLIEIISFISRPLSLSVRLFANMLAGHIMLKVFAGFAITMAGAGSIWALLSPLPLLLTVAVTALEFLVAFLQAYVFAILTCVYLNDALNPGH